MRTSRADGLETRRKLLDAAGLLFAERGYHDTKTGDICSAAQANIAAVHYHFRSKEDIYVAAWRHEFERSISVYPPDGGVSADASAKDRLRGHIQALVRRFIDPASRDLDIVHREMSNPTGLLAEVMHRSIEPLREMHLRIIRELLGPDTTDQDVHLCEMSIHAQCVVSLMHERQRRLAPQDARHPHSPFQRVDESTLTEHIFRFSLAGLQAVRKAAGRVRSNTKDRRKGGRP